MNNSSNTHLHDIMGILENHTNSDGQLDSIQTSKVISHWRAGICDGESNDFIGQDVLNIQTLISHSVMDELIKLRSTLKFEDQLIQHGAFIKPDQRAPRELWLGTLLKYSAFYKSVE